MPVLKELLEANKRFAEGFEKGNLPMPPARQVAVLTCMDARLHPERFLGLDIGDAHVIRNAGGRASASREKTPTPSGATTPPGPRSASGP